MNAAVVIATTTNATICADLIFQMDADFSHDPKYLPAMAAAIVPWRLRLKS